jgi:hypothetical protein
VQEIVRSKQAMKGGVKIPHQRGEGQRHRDIAVLGRALDKELVEMRGGGPQDGPEKDESVATKAFDRGRTLTFWALRGFHGRPSPGRRRDAISPL